MPDFLTTPTFYFSLFGLGFTLFAWLHKNSGDKLKAAEERFDKLVQRVCATEDTQKVSLPRFHEMDKQMTRAQETFNHIELRFQGADRAIERLGDHFEDKLAAHDKDIRDIKTCIDKLEQKFDKNTEKILDKLEALTTHHPK